MLQLYLLISCYQRGTALGVILLPVVIKNTKNGLFWPKCQHRNRGIVYRNTSSELLQEEGTEHVRIQLWIQSIWQIPCPCSGSDLIPVPITVRKICSPCPPPMRRKPEQAGWEEAVGHTGQAPGALAQGNKSQGGKWVMLLISWKEKKNRGGRQRKHLDNFSPFTKNKIPAGK